MKRVSFRFAALVMSCMIAFLAAVPVLRTEAAGEVPQNPGPRGTITYDFGQGQTFVLDPSASILLCVQNRDGSFYVDPVTGRCVVDPAKCLTFLNALQKMYPRVTGGGNAFRTTRGDLIPVSGATSTVYFDVNTELQWLYAALTSDLTARRSPDFHGVQPGSAYSNTNALGGTYIEIDLTMQALYYYVNGTLVLSTPIVSGNTSA
ncbi:MAG: L,D-transpeptidase, partial [Lachnospiraceae bacterium]|nr:L,D-transpeptidase [Lachnospiraceae bacterium]